MMLTDAMLRSAAREVRDAMLSSLPEPEDCPAYTASPSFERRMLCLLNDPAGYGKKMTRTRWQKALHTAAVFAMTIGLSAALLFAVSPTVRAAVKQWFMNIRRSDIVYYFTGETRGEGLPYYTITELPEGYEATGEVTELPGYRSIDYKNAQGKQIRLEYNRMDEGAAFWISTENMAVSDISVNGRVGQVFIAQIEEKSSGIIWVDEESNIQFFINAFADESVLLHMAESVSLVKK